MEDMWEKNHDWGTTWQKLEEWGGVRGWEGVGKRFHFLLRCTLWQQSCKCAFCFAPLGSAFLPDLEMRVIGRAASVNCPLYFLFYTHITTYCSRLPWARKRSTALVSPSCKITTTITTWVKKCLTSSKMIGTVQILCKVLISLHHFPVTFHVI